MWTVQPAIFWSWDFWSWDLWQFHIAFLLSRTSERAAECWSFPTKKHAIQTCSVSLRIDINMAQHKTINCWVRFFCRIIYFVSRLYSSWAWPSKSHYCAIMPKDWTHLQGNPQALTVNQEPFSAHWCMVLTTSSVPREALGLLTEEAHTYSPLSPCSFVFCVVRSFANWVTSSSFVFASFRRLSYPLPSFSAFACEFQKKIRVGRKSPQ